MQDEIEIKIMLLPENIALIKQWLTQQPIQKYQRQTLGNTYFDTPELFFAKAQMGLRVRTKNNQHEITLKMKGDIVGGLHIRPEYNLDLPNSQPDFKRLVSHYNLQIANSDAIAENLQATFSTDFERESWLLNYQHSQIEIALDMGIIKNRFGEEPICELEFELKQGNLADLFALIQNMPKRDGMWLSSLSKAQRGYFVGRMDKIAKEIEKLSACHLDNMAEVERYQAQQQMADFLRLSPEATILRSQLGLEHIPLGDIFDYLTSARYLDQQLSHMQQRC
ncbi:CYTH domain-containing protein [Bibersteinia trehalosi]|uniref:CYTH domain-containing protein n=1 Tax=Bibersteinia trehalosi TaxID=47735 RepID=A0A3R8SPH1_BIBTR|nr:CYTH domain-containing protein [Bibersteinia trehalosi]RRN01015.1 CYTH domain-containing protein [Bibersteinia trehalosi]